MPQHFVRRPLFGALESLPNTVPVAPRPSPSWPLGTHRKEADSARAHCIAEQEDLAPFPEEEDEGDEGDEAAALGEDPRAPAPVAGGDV